MSTIGHNQILLFTISVSIFGIFIVLIFAFNPPITHENFFWRKPLIGSVFGLISLLGIFAAFFPKQCSKTFNFEKEKTSFTSHTDYATFKGHHPNCKEFSAHVIHVNNHTFCAACNGLLLGATVALIGAAFYFSGLWQIGETSFLLILIGVVGVVLGFFQLKFKGFIRLILNAFFVFGAFLILAGIDELTQSLFVDLFLILLIVFWLFTRIQLSQWDHLKICNSCKVPCEIRDLKKKQG